MRPRRTIPVALAAVLGLGATLVGVPTPGPASGAAPARPYDVGKLPVVAAPGAQNIEGTRPPEANIFLQAVADGVRRRAYQFFDAESGSQATVFDLDTKAVLRKAPMSLPFKNTAMVVQDAARGRVFLGRASGGLIRVDQAALEAGAPNAIRDFPITAQELSFTTLVGLSVDSKRNKVLAWYNGQQNLPEGVLAGTIGRGRMVYYVNWLAQFDAETGQQDWVHRVEQCNVGMLNQPTSNAAPFWSGDGRSLNVLCGAGDGGSQLVALEVDATGKPTGNARFTTTGPSPLGRVVMDPKRERAYIFTLIGYLVVYDWRDGRVLGTVAISPVVSNSPFAPGLDEASGRLYVFLSPAPSSNASEQGGLLVIDAFRTPVPQALVYRDIVINAGVPSAVVASASNGHSPLVLGRGAYNLGAAEPFYRVIADPVPLSTDPPSDNPDRTTDTDESDVTERSFAGETSGYGARALVVGGAFAQGQTGGTAEGELTGRCGLASRDVIAGYVRRAGLSNLVASGAASPLDSDLGTQEDARDLSRCWTTPFVPGTSPPAGTNTGPGFTPATAQCSGDDEKSATDQRNSGAAASVKCERAKDTVTARASYPVLGAGPVSVGRAITTNDLRRDPVKGLVARVESAVEDITIENGDQFLRIARVYSSAEAASNGRKSKAPSPRSTWTVQVCGVQVPGFTQQGCQKPDQAIDALNRAGRNRIVFKQPQPEPYLRQGTPGGYLAGIQREAGDMSLARLEHGDDLFVVPGLEIQVRNDYPKGYNRYIVQLAGVRAVSAYGISVLPPALSAGDDNFSSTTDNGTVSSGPIIPDLGHELTDFVSAIAAAGAAASSTANGSGGGGGPIETIGNVIRTGWELLVRDPVDALLLAGAWSVLAAPVYLAIRRRRLGVAV